MQERTKPIWDHTEIYIPDEILVPLVDPEMTPTISLSQLRNPNLRDPILEIVTGIEDPEQIVQKKTRQSLHQRGRDGAAGKRILMKGRTFASTRMSPQQLNADEDAVNFELLANGYVLKGSTLEEHPIDPDDSDKNEFDGDGKVNVFIAPQGRRHRSGASAGKYRRNCQVIHLKWAI